MLLISPSGGFSPLIRIAAALLLAVAMPSPLLSQAITWNDINGIAQVTQFDRGGGDTLFAVDATMLYGIGSTRYYISTDDGVSWFKSPVAAGAIYSMQTKGAALLVDREVSGVAYDHQVFFSTDNGSTFSRVLAEAGVTHFPFAISDSSVLFANRRVSYTAYVLSRFNGTQWIDIGAQTGSFDYLLVDGTNFYGIPFFSSHGLFSSNDYGQHWNLLIDRSIGAAIIDSRHRLLAGVNATINTQGVITQTGGVFISTDNGQSWANTGLGDQIFYALSVDSAGNICAGTASGVFRYTPATGAWTNISPVPDVYPAVEISQSGTILASCADAWSSPVAFASHPAVYRSTDNGATWSISGLRRQPVFCLTAGRNGDLVAGTLGNRVLVSADSGASWRQAPTGSVADNVYSVASDSISLYAATDEGLFASPHDIGSWSNLSAPAVTGAAYAVAVSGAGTLFIGTSFGVYSSTDRGASWNASGLGTSKVLFLAISPSDALYAATESDGVYSSTDAGASWQSCGLVRNDLQTITVDGFGNVLVGVYGGIFRSTDGGATWSQSTFVNSYVYGIAVQGGQTIFAGTYSGALVSYDGGATWKSAGLGGQIVMSFAFTPAGNLIAGVYHGGVFQTAQVITSVGSGGGGLPLSDELLPNYPNPFNPSTSVSFVIGPAGGGSVARLSVYDLLGREVAVLVNGRLRPGRHTVVWNASGLPSGIYFCRLQAGEFVGVRKLVLAR